MPKKIEYMSTQKLVHSTIIHSRQNVEAQMPIGGWVDEMCRISKSTQKVGEWLLKTGGVGE
jgi:hypothetical protein